MPRAFTEKSHLYLPSLLVLALGLPLIGVLGILGDTEFEWMLLEPALHSLYLLWKTHHVYLAAVAMGTNLPSLP